MPTIAPSRAYLPTRPARPRLGAATSDYVFSIPTCRCPVCGSMLNQIPRRRVDRLLSVVVSVRRFSCYSSVCGWEGILREV